MSESHQTDQTNLQINFCPLHKFQELAGKLQYTLFGITVYQAFKTTTSNLTMTEHMNLDFMYWQTLVHNLSTNPTPVQVLVSKYPNYIQYKNSYMLGSGGVINPGMTPVPYFVWNSKWLHDIQEEMTTAATPTGTLTINKP